MASFLGKVGGKALNFLGKAAKVGNYLGKNISQVQKGLKTVSGLAQNPTVQAAGGALGLKSNLFKRIGDTTNNLANVLPGAQQTAREINTSLQTGKRSIADLYTQLNTAS
jgi:hypothetical protein